LDYYPVVETYKEFDHLTIVADFPEKDPQIVFEYWVNPSLISEWWGPPLVRLDPKVGGGYAFQWPKQNWILRGEYTRFEPANTLEFTWKWDHEPGEPVRKVLVSFQKLDNRTRMFITQGAYARSDTEQRKSHLEGWMFFIPRMQKL
jgi:uncharacterized protein YndB with AHSA1/START domain